MQAHLVLNVNGESYSSISHQKPAKKKGKFEEFFMYKYEETTQLFCWSKLDPRLVLPTAYLSVRFFMLHCDVLVDRLRGGACGAKLPTNKGGLGAKPTQFGK